VLLIVNLAMLAHLVQWWITGRTLSPVEPSESMYTLEQGMVNAGIIFFTLALLSTAIFGRFICGWGCHLIALQDACSWMMKKIGVRPKPFRSRLLIYVPLTLAIYMFVWPTFKREVVAPFLKSQNWDYVLRIIGNPPPFPGFSNHIMTEDFLATIPTIWVTIPFLILTGFVTVYFLGSKGFCTYGCPYGGFFAPLEKIAPGRIVVDHDKCHQCGQCTAACTSNVRVNEEIRAFGMVVNPGCMKCMDCVSVCPNDALSFKFAKPSVLKGKAVGKPPRKIYDLTWPGEIAIVIVFIIAFFAWRGLYGIIPMLMASGIAGCITFLTWKLWRLGRDRDVRIIGAQLKRAGSIRPAGVVFALLVSVTLLLTAQSILVRYQRFRGELIDSQVLVTRDAAFSDVPGAVPDEMRARAQKALDRYRLASGWKDGGYGLMETPSVQSRVAWLHLVRGERDQAIDTLKRMNHRLGPNDTRTVDLATILALSMHEDSALALLENTLEEHPRFSLTRNLLVSAYLSQGRLDDAINLRRDAIDPDDFNRQRLASNRALLAALLLQKGEIPESIELLGAAVESMPTVASIRNDYAVALFMGGQGDRAIQEMHRTIELTPDDAPLRIRLSQMLSQLGRQSESQQALEEARRIDPSLFETR